jgi:hypothetical protein
MVKSKLLVLFVFFGVAMGEHPLSAEVPLRALKDPEKTLARSRDPLDLVEEFLIIQDTGPVETYRSYLEKKGKDAHLSRLRFLQERYAGNNAGALQILEKMDPKDPWVVAHSKELIRLKEIEKTFVETKSDHFTVRTRMDDAFLVPYALPSLENAYGQVADFFGSSPTLTSIIEIYPTVDQFAVASTLSNETVEETGIVTTTRYGRVMILSPGAIPFGYRWIDGLLNEYILFHLTRVTGGRCPGWLQQGMARYLTVNWQREEGFAHSPSDRALLTRALLVDKGTPMGLLPLDQLDPSSITKLAQSQRQMALAEAVDAVDFIVQEFGLKNLTNLLHSFREMPQDEAFQKTLGMDDQEFEQRWRESLADLTEVPIDLTRGSLEETIHFGEGDDLLLVASEEVRGWLREGDQWRQKGFLDKAVFKYKKAIEKEPDNGVALSRLAQVYTETQKIPSAEELLNRAMEKNDSYALPYVLTGRICFDEGRYEEAQQALQQALEINPFEAKPHEILGRTAVDVGNFLLAKQSLSLALRFDPTNRSVRQLLQHLPKPR